MLEPVRRSNGRRQAVIEHNRPFGMATPMYFRTAQDTRHSLAKCGCHRLVNLHCKARFNIGHRVAN